MFGEKLREFPKSSHNLAFPSVDLIPLLMQQTLRQETEAILRPFGWGIVGAGRGRVRYVGFEDSLNES